MTNHRHASRLLPGAVLTVAISLVLAACSGATASVAPSVASVAPEPTATPTAAPTPSPTPIDASAAFTKAITASDFSAVVKVSGKLKIGTVDGDITGDGKINGKDSTSSQRVSAGTFTQVNSGTRIGSTSWSRKSPGPWLEDLESASKGSSLNDYLQRVGGIVDLGVVTYAGQQLHHLQPKGGNTISPDDIGFDVSGATDAKFTIDFYSTDDGTPVIVAVAGSWTQVSGDASVPTEVTFEYAFSDVGKPQTITAPDDVWVRYTSTVNGYTMAHPAGWTVKGAKDKDTYLLNDQPYVYVGLSAFKGTTPAFVTALKKAYKKNFGDPVSENATRLGGESAVRLLYQFTNTAKQDVTLVDDVVSHGGTGWEVFMVTQGGTEDVAVFDQFVATFEFTK